MMYFLVLAALLQLEDTAPRMISPHRTYDECAQAASKANKDERLQSPDAKEKGLRFVCMRMMGDA
jgi:hypothetical protein